MLDARLHWLQEAGNATLIRHGLRGLEKESLRVDAHGRLSLQKHPPSLGSALTHPYITTDYSEALLEFVTPPYGSNWETLQFLCDTHRFVHLRLGDELLWPSSMPCLMNPEHEIPIADYGPTNLGLMKSVYRRGLGYRYGRAMQAISGVHFNYSLPGSFWAAYREREKSSDDLQHFRSEQYMALVRNYRRYGWLVMYLFGSSPAVCKSFSPIGGDFLEELDATTLYAPFATSLRMSDIGYRNKSQSGLAISANSVDQYVAGLRDAVSTSNPEFEKIGISVKGEYRQLNANTLQIENEYYSTIRPKPRAGSVHRPTIALARAGVEYVEIRTLDLNMLDPVGINQVQMRFLEAFIIFCLLAESPPIDVREQREVDARELMVAREGRRPGLRLPRDGRSIGLAQWGGELLEGVAAVCERLDGDRSDYTDALQAQSQAVKNPELTPSARVLSSLRSASEGFLQFTLGLAQAHRDYFLALLADGEKDRFFRDLADASLAEARTAAEQDEKPFERYLAEYFSQI